jgi:hypothetical protein
MTHRDADRFSLAVDAVTAAFTLVARHTTSSGTKEIIDMHRRLRTLRAGGADSLRLTLHSLHTLAAAPQLFAFRLVTNALAQSLPRACSAQVTAQDVRTAAFDLKRLQQEATSLRAPDVAVNLSRIIDAMLGPGDAVGAMPSKDSLH